MRKYLIFSLSSYVVFIRGKIFLLHFYISTDYFHKLRILISTVLIYFYLITILRSLDMICIALLSLSHAIASVSVINKSLVLRLHIHSEY